MFSEKYRVLTSSQPKISLVDDGFDDGRVLVHGPMTYEQAAVWAKAFVLNHEKNVKIVVPKLSRPEFRHVFSGPSSGMFYDLQDGDTLELF